jgi:hypothetical protein
VTDVNGAAIVGASVQLGSQRTVSTQFGTYVIPNVIVPAGQTSLVTQVTASATVNGVSWTGQNLAEVPKNAANSSNVHIVLSAASQQGSLSGVVQDAQSHPIVGAHVFVGNLLPADPTVSGDVPHFGNLSSITAITDSTGRYTVAGLPPGSAYVVTASAPGYLNATLNTVALNAKQQKQLAAFVLNLSSGTSSVPVVTDFSLSSITTPAVTTRAAVRADGTSAMEVIKRYIWKQRGLLNHREAAPNTITRRRVTSRSPSGTIIENDLFWTYTPLNNLYGYVILNSVGDDTHFQSIATLRDALADRFSDIDSILEPDTLYYYSLARLDTINYPTNGAEGTPINPLVTEPLGPETLVSPLSGATVGSTPTFQWTAVNRAAKYGVLVYAQFPSYQPDNPADGGVQPYWVSSSVTGQQTTYQGPALVSGHTYWWAVLAADDTNSAYSISPLQTFVVH